MSIQALQPLHALSVIRVDVVSGLYCRWHVPHHRLGNLARAAQRCQQRAPGAAPVVGRPIGHRQISRPAAPALGLRAVGLQVVDLGAECMLGVLRTLDVFNKKARPPHRSQAALHHLARPPKQRHAQINSLSKPRILG